ncbi:MAG: hypothetical protein LC794_07945 [Acidobacteria bacterium]|nr:hypothetical protein [Acidobacteriota bacterium]
MHTGQIIMFTKMLTSSDLRFYDFSGVEPSRTLAFPAVNWSSLPHIERPTLPTE